MPSWAPCESNRGYYILVRVRALHRKGVNHPRNHPRNSEVQLGFLFNAPPGKSKDVIIRLLQDNADFQLLCTQYTPDNTQITRISFEKVTEMGHGPELHCLGMVVDQ